jgi:hypothetical protein
MAELVEWQMLEIKGVLKDDEDGSVPPRALVVHCPDGVQESSPCSSVSAVKFQESFLHSTLF